MAGTCIEDEEEDDEKQHHEDSVEDGAEDIGLAAFLDGQDLDVVELISLLSHQ
jgi:hypothetical protein